MTESSNDEKALGRRQLFKSAFVSVAEKAIEYVGEKEKKAAPKISKKKICLRPPGAVEESQFISLCTRCDECIKVCPHNCIRYDDSDTGKGAAIIVAKEAACRLCPDLPCIKACATGALQPVDNIKDLKIGVAVIEKARCLDYVEEQFSRCQQCYRQCPFPDEAIYIDEDSRPVIRGEKCVGCGICENVCQAINSPSAIRVIAVPRETKEIKDKEIEDTDMGKNTAAAP